MKKVALLSLVASSVLMAGGYKVPEVSTNGVALSAANVAHNKSADAAYYNPANMVFMKHNGIIETDFMYVGLAEINYKGTSTSALGTTGPHNIDSKDEHFFIPSLHYVSPDVDGARYGLSIISPAGLSKRWDSAPAIYTAEEFTLKTVEVNPSIALPIGDKVGIAIGIRAIYSKGDVRSTSPIASRSMDGDSLDFGYNLAIAYHPTKELELAVTYRSNIDLSVDGDAKLSFTDLFGSFTAFTGSPAGTTYTSDSSANVEVPVPALLNVAAAYTFSTGTTVEFVYERNYWHEYKELDFNYGSGVNLATNQVFGAVVPKNWKDTDAFRLGVTQELDELTLMAGVVIDETPVPDNTLGYELPDSDSVSVSFGARYQVTDKINVGLATLYSIRDDRTVTNDSLSGEFTDSAAFLVSAGLEYRF